MKLSFEATIDPVTLKVTSFGKFKGEPRWVPYFHAQWTTEPGQQVEFYVTAEDVALFPELHGFYQVRIHEDDQGFVWGQAIPEPPQTKEHNT